MPVNITPVDAWPSAFQEAQDGDAVSQATRVNVIQEYADALTYLYNRALAQGGGTTVTHNVPLGAALHDPGADFSFVEASSFWQHTGVAGADIVWPVSLPILMTSGFNIWQLNTITVWSEHIGGGHGGSPPAVPPQLDLWMLDGKSTSTRVNIASFTDPSTAATLDTRHSWSLGLPTPHAFVQGAAYYVEWTTESGANSQTDTALYNVIFDIALVS